MGQKIMRQWLLFVVLCLLFSSGFFSLAFSLETYEQTNRHGYTGSQRHSESQDTKTSSCFSTRIPVIRSFRKLVDLGLSKAKEKFTTSQRDVIETPDQLADNKAIIDVIDMFNPTAELRVQYGYRQVINGSEMASVEALTRPYVHFSTQSPTHNNLFTLVMVDPDSPNSLQPIYKEFLHWMIINIPETRDASQGQEVAAYINPTPLPLSGIHRFVFVLFRHSGPIGLRGPIFIRTNFNTRSFAAQKGLGLPAAALYFTAHM